MPIYSDKGKQSKLADRILEPVGVWWCKFIGEDQNPGSSAKAGVGFFQILFWCLHFCFGEDIERSGGGAAVRAFSNLLRRPFFKLMNSIRLNL